MTSVLVPTVRSPWDSAVSFSFSLAMPRSCGAGVGAGVGARAGTGSTLFGRKPWRRRIQSSSGFHGESKAPQLRERVFDSCIPYPKSVVCVMHLISFKNGDSISQKMSIFFLLEQVQTPTGSSSAFHPSNLHGPLGSNQPVATAKRVALWRYRFLGPSSIVMH